MSSRRRFIATCSGGLCLTAGCFGFASPPDIPRETKVLDDRVTIQPGAFHAWPLSERIATSSFTPNGTDPVFSYEFVVEDGPGVVVAATTSDEVQRREETGGRYRMWGGTRSEGTRGALREPMPVALLEVLVADNQYLGEKTPPPDRAPATVHVQAYLSHQRSD